MLEYTIEAWFLTQIFFWKKLRSLECKQWFLKDSRAGVTTRSWVNGLDRYAEKLNMVYYMYLNVTYAHRYSERWLGLEKRKEHRRERRSRAWRYATHTTQRPLLPQWIVVTADSALTQQSDQFRDPAVTHFATPPDQHVFHFFLKLDSMIEITDSYLNMRKLWVLGDGWMNREGVATFIGNTPQMRVMPVFSIPSVAQV